MSTIPASHNFSFFFSFFFFPQPDGLKRGLVENDITACESNVVTGLDCSSSLPDGDQRVCCFISWFESLDETVTIKSVAMLVFLQVLPAVSVSPLFPRLD